MDTKFSTKHKFRRLFANILSIFAILAIAFPATGVAYAQEPSPFIRAHPVWDNVDAWFWPQDVTLHLSIDDPNTETFPDLEMDMPGEVDPSLGSVWFDFAGVYNLKPGDLVTVTDSVTTRSLTVSSLSIDAVDVDANTASGTVEPGAQVRLPSPDSELFVTGNSDGYWFADFNQIGFDLIPGTTVIAEAWDEDGDNSSFERYISNPHFTVFPDWEFFDGLDWPDGTIVSISVEGKPECATTKESWGGFFNGNFGEGCDVVFGDTVTFTDGITTRTHVVRNLYVTDVDTSTNTVMGKADAGETVYVWPHDGGFEPLQTIVSESGIWQVDLDDAGYIIREDSEGRSEIRDEMGNATASDWHVTHPRFTVFPEWEWFDGNDWPNGATVTITVAGKPECSTAKESWGYFFNGSFGEECDLVIGDTVTFTDGETTRTHTVQNLAVTKANYNDNTIKGIANPGAEVYVWPHATGEQQLAIAKTKGAAEGKWNVDFSGIYDLAPGECGRSEIRDEFGNSTAVDWCTSDPRIVASESGDWFWTTGFKPGDLDISIYDSPDAGANLLWSGQQVADESGFAFVGSDIHGQDLLPGNYLVVSDDDSQKSLVLQPISVTVFDTENEIMAGFAPAGSEVWAAAGPQEWQQRIMAQADAETGAWSADFKTVGFDITEDMRGWSYAHIYDEDGDANEGGTPPHPMSVIMAHPAYETVEGSDWLPGTEVILKIDNPANENEVDYSATQVVGEDTWLHFQLTDFDLQAGDIVTMTDGQYTQTMVVSTLRVTGFYLDTHTVFGIGDPGSKFKIADNGMLVSVDDEGNWSTTFEQLAPGSWWTIIQTYSDGNEVRETFRAPVPVIFAHPAYNVIDGHEWTPGGEVTITIDDPTNGPGADYTQTAVASGEINYLYDTGVHFDLAFDLRAGDIITMTDGHFTQTMVVSTLQVTGFNLDAHTVSGVGDPGSEFIIADNGMNVAINDEGNWSATYEQLTPGSWWTIIQRYEDGNEMRETFRAPMPMMIAWKNWDDVAGSEWTPGAEVTLTVDDPTNGQSVDYTFTETAVGSGNLYYGEVYFNLGIELQTGYVLTMSDGNFTKTLVMSALTVTGYNFNNRTVYGTGDPGTQLLVHLGGLASDLVTVGDDHNWSVYHELLEPGVWFDAIQTDEDGDQTRDGGQAL